MTASPSRPSATAKTPSRVSPLPCERPLEGALRGSPVPKARLTGWLVGTRTATEAGPLEP